MRNAYSPPRAVLLEAYVTDIITASREYPTYNNGNMGEWDDVN